MAERQFKFSSPGIFLKEIDNSQLPAQTTRVGPVIIGRTKKGPAMCPILVQSFEDFVDVFGEPVPGVGGGDQWRDGNTIGPTYAAYAAQAYLRANGPVTMIRLLGEDSDDASTAGTAGWQTLDSSGAANSLDTGGGGAYGLFIVDSGSNAANQTDLTGTLAAIFYCGEGAVFLSGTTIGAEADKSYAAAPMNSVAKNTFILEVSSSTAGTEGIEFNFDPNDKKFIRKVFNTNPTLTNASIVSDQKYYWLGESFENDVQTRCTASAQIGIILGLAASGSATGQEQSKHTYARHDAKTPWIVSQHVGTAADFSETFANVQKLFRLVSIKGGSWASQNLKVSIADLRASRSPYDPYGTFSVLVRKASDSDASPNVLERYTHCNLNPNSENYVAKKIGDQHLAWVESERTYRLIGDYANRSRYFRVEVDERVKNGGINKGLIPFGFYGPPRFKGFTIVSGAATPKQFDTVGTVEANPFVEGSGSVLGYPTTHQLADQFVYIKANQVGWKTKFQFPTLPLRLSSKETGVSLSKPENTYWGIVTTLTGTDSRFNQSYGDILRPSPAGISDSDKAVPADDWQEYSFYFTMDNLSASADNVADSIEHAVYLSTSRKAGTSLTAQVGVTGTLDKGFDRFTMPVIGGADGVNILEQEPFGHHVIGGASETEKTNYAYYSVKRAIDTVEDAEYVRMNILSAPGIRATKLTQRMIDVAEKRGDTLAIIDLTGDYTPSTEATTAESARIGSVNTTITNLESRAINSSYACAYYPWVQVRDSLSGNNVWVPPSVVALGVMGTSETRSELWFAPAGFNRGGLTDGAAGLSVVGVRQRLTSKERDKLYEKNINPIASFPAEGIVVFGQKTLQVTPSALDRINVRRLMIFVKREISLMANDILFDQNVQATWNRFLGRVNPFLTNVKIRFGLSDFLVVLDESTTTPDLVDRNIMYAKVFLKPARAIEFIALDFVITNTGAEFLE